MQSLPELWKEWEIRLTVLLSFILQLFLLLAGSVHRRKVNVVHRALLWLAYVGADGVSVFALGLISRYSEKCKLQSCSFGDTQPFLWTPSLLVHLGGQDSITAYSIEDNNLWLRHLLKLGMQGSLALYIFGKSIYIIDPRVVIPAACMFLCGIIKYGERIWALKSASRDGLAKEKLQPADHRPPGNMNSYALQTVLHARGLFVGRTLLQLGLGIRERFIRDLVSLRGEEKLRIIEMELGMMFDLLYTKAMVLQSWMGWMFRFCAQIFMVVAFVLFQNRVNVWMSSNFFLKEKGDMDAVNHDWINIGISYALFIGAICMEACSVAMVMTSLWTRGHLVEDTFLHWLFISNACCNFMTTQYDRMMQCLSSDSIGQFNYIDYIMHVPTSALFCKVINAFGLGKHWINLRYVKYSKTEGRIVHYIKGWFSTTYELQLGPLLDQRRLNYTLSMPFEHVLYRLHIFTDLHISKQFEGPAVAYPEDVMELKEDCLKLSNYMLYLREMHPSMLPVSVGVSGKTLFRHENQERRARLLVVQDHANNLRNESEDAACPFMIERITGQDDLKRSLENIREIWIRLLLYAAGKCGGELHARQLGNGGELLSFVWLLMLHHNLGDAATEYKLLVSAPGLPKPGSLVAAEGGNWTQQGEPCYAFDFSNRTQRNSPSMHLASLLPAIRLSDSSVAPRRGRPGTSREPERDQRETQQDIP